MDGTSFFLPEHVGPTCPKCGKHFFSGQYGEDDDRGGMQHVDCEKPFDTPDA